MVASVAAMALLLIATVAYCGPPVGDERGRAQDGQQAPQSAQQGQGPSTTGQGGDAFSYSPQSGFGGADGSGAASPMIMMSNIDGAKKSVWQNIQRVAFPVKVPRSGSSVVVQGDFIFSNHGASGRYNGSQLIQINQNGLPVSNPLHVYNGHELDVKYNVRALDLMFLVDHNALSLKKLRIGPSFGVSRWSGYMNIDDLSVPSFSGSGSHSGLLFKVGAWGNIPLGGLTGTSGRAGFRLDPCISWQVAGGAGGDGWKVWNWEALLNLLASSKDSMGSWVGSRYSKYVPSLMVSVGVREQNVSQTGKDVDGIFQTSGGVSTTTSNFILNQGVDLQVRQYVLALGFGF